MRRTDGDETWNRLLNWTKGSKSSERLAAHILRAEGFKSVDPSHPLGGKDGLKDILSVKENLTWIGGAFFPRGQKSFQETKKKFLKDLAGIKKNNANGLAFVTNQELTLKQRTELKNLGKPHSIEIYHLERTSGLLDTPENYGIRLEFLDIELTKEEQLSFFAKRDEKIFNISEKLDGLMMNYSSFKKSFELGIDREMLNGRTEEEIAIAIDEYADKIWYGRHQAVKYQVGKKKLKVDPEIWKGALKSAKIVEKKYGLKNLGPYSDFDWGMINGKLSALRWVFGDDWDMLDS